MARCCSGIVAVGKRSKNFPINTRPRYRWILLQKVSFIAVQEHLFGCTFADDYAESCSFYSPMTRARKVGVKSGHHRGLFCGRRKRSRVYQLLPDPKMRLEMVKGPKGDGETEELGRPRTGGAAFGNGRLYPTACTLQWSRGS
jgi:hypothetical protein